MLNINKVRYIAGFDSSYRGNTQYAVVVVYDVHSRITVERAHSTVEVNVPYIPGLLAFRELPGYIKAYNKLRVKPEIMLVDGHGLTHPRAFGIASHLGLVLDKPSIGVAKSHLYGTVINQSNRKLVKAHGRIVGEILVHEGEQIYISIGYKIKLEDAVEIVKRLLVPGRKLPLPIQIADEYSKIIKSRH